MRILAALSLPPSMASAAVVLALSALVFSPPTRAQATGTAVEYYHAGFDHYFVTSYAHEIANLDAGAYGGVWTRTGRTLPVWTGPGTGLSETCRFFSESFAPRSSHFYTPVQSECDLRKQDPAWTFEAVAFFLRTSPTGTCPAGTIALYRLYNANRSGAPNHRYTTSRAVFDQMRAQGWIAEGNGPDIVFACVPAATSSAGTAEGMWSGTTSQNVSFLAWILDNGAFYVLYSVPGNADLIAGAIIGTGISNNGQFTSANARDFNILGLGVTDVVYAGTYVAGVSFSGVGTSPSGSGSYTAVYDSRYLQPVSLAAVAGTYIGQAATSLGIADVAITINANGDLTGSGIGCSFTGTALPRGSVNVANLTVRFLGGGCVFGTSTLTGMAYYNPATRSVMGMAPNASRTDGFVFIGTK